MFIDCVGCSCKCVCLFDVISKYTDAAAHSTMVVNKSKSKTK